MGSRRPASTACLLVVLRGAAALSGCGPGNSPPLLDGGVDRGNARYQVRQSVGQLHVTHAPPGLMLGVFDGASTQVQTGVADKLGSLVFRKLPAGSNYQVRTIATGVTAGQNSAPLEYAGPLRVYGVDESQPAQGFYAAQKLVPGFNYIHTRDGTTLSAYVTLPGPLEMGPYPTVVDYSGYAPSKPGEPLAGGKYAFLCDQLPSICDAPNDPSAMIATLLGFATVSVNMRGTGCSGGAYDYFETLQLLDGYDVIEVVGAQDWVQLHKVGMTGLSYPGITQLFVAKMQPPSLAAITPLSVIGNTATTLLPGGILNDGFALNWAKEVYDRADPYGQGWEQKRVDGGDSICQENQLLHAQKYDILQDARNTPFYVPARVDPLNPTLFASQIRVPVFLAGAWQDEQTGPFFTTLLDQFTAAPVKRFTVYNGNHADGFAPQVLVEWGAFLSLYVAHRVPRIDPAMRDLSPILFQQTFGAPMRLPPNPYERYKTYEEARAAFEAAPPLRVIFDNGGGVDFPGAPSGPFERSFSQWPPKEQSVRRYYLHADGTLADRTPTEATASSSFLLDPDAGKRGIVGPKGGLWGTAPDWNWQQSAAGKALVFVTPVLTEEQAMVGTGSVDVWIQSTADDADLQVTISEVRPDGSGIPDKQETFVQCGWLRASHRTLAASATDLWPEHTDLEKDALALPPGKLSMARVAIAGFGHVFRKGSRIKLTIDTPGGTRPDWRFGLKRFPGPVTHTIAHSATYPSSVTLPLIAMPAAPTGLPPCPGLRGQACRDYAPYVNMPGN